MFRRNLIGILVISLLVTGCWDRREIEERLLVAAIGVDSTKDGDVFTFQVPIPNQVIGKGSSGGSTQSGGDGGTIQMYGEQANTLTEAIKKIREKGTQEPFLGYTQLLLIGEEKAKQGISVVMQGLRQHPEIRRQFWPIVVKGEAKELLNLPAKIDIINSVVIREILKNGVRRGRFPDVTLKDLFIDLSNPVRRNPILNVIKVNEHKKIEWGGVAAFKNDKMIDTLSDSESDALNQIRGKQAGRYLTIPCSKGKGTLGFRPNRTRRVMHISDKPAITIDMYVTGTLRESSCNYNMHGTKRVKLMKNILEKQYNKNGRQLIDRAQKMDQTDYLLLGDYIHSYRPDLWKKLNWKKDFPHIPIQVRYHVNVERLGIIVP